jgi:hypothetical protein
MRAHRVPRLPFFSNRDANLAEGYRTGAAAREADFGKTRPEANLMRLFRIYSKSGRATF